MRSEAGKLYDDILVQLVTDPNIKKVDHTQILKTTSEVIAKTLDVEQVSIYKLEMGRFGLIPLNVFHAPTRTHHFSEEINLQKMPSFYNAILVNRFLDIFQYKNDPYFSELKREPWGPEDVKSVLFVPLRGGGQLIGLLKIDQIRSRRIWIEEEINFACQTADVIAMNLLYAEILQYRNASEMILSYVQDLQKIDQFEHLSDQFVCYTTRAIQADSVLMFKVDPHMRRLWVTHTYQAPAGYGKLSLDYQDGAAGMVADQTKTILVNDYANYAYREQLYDVDKPFHIVIAKPVIRDGEVIAVIQAMRSSKQQGFGPFEDCVLDQMIAWYGVFINRYRLTEKMETIREYQHTLNRIIETGYFSSGIQDLINTILDYCMPVLKARMAVVGLGNNTVNRGLPIDFEQKMTVLFEENNTWRSSGICIPTVNPTDEIHPSLVQLIQSEGIQSLLMVPLLLEEQRIGYILIASPYYSEWSRDEITLLEITSKHLALEYHRTQINLKNKNQSNLIGRMNTLGQKLSYTLTYDEAIEVVGNTAVDMLTPDNAFLLLRQPLGSINTVYAYGMPSWKIQQMFEFDKDGFEKKFLENKHPVFFTVDSETELPEKFIEYIQTFTIKSVKILPLLYQNQVLGVFVSMHKKAQSWPDYERNIMGIFANTAVLTLQNAWMYDELEKGYLELALALAGAMDERETKVSDCTLKIANWAEKTARYVGCAEDEIQDIRWAALLHDIGKLEIPEHVLRKPGPLSEDEWNLVQQAPKEAEKLIKPLTRYRTVGMILSSYHEHYDGNGYPNQLKGRQIPLGARILALAEAFMSMIDHRYYREAMQPEEAIQEIKKNSGRQFDPIIVEAFINSWEGAELSV